MKKIFSKLYSGSLTDSEAMEFAQLLVSPEISAEQKAAALVLMETRKPTMTEMESMANYLLQNCLVPFKTNEPLLDVCGTGGDGKSTLNISTLCALITSTAGVKVCKHGNYGITSVNGSSNVLEYLGYEFKQDCNLLEEELNKFNITFLHAPFFHPVLKEISMVRKNLKVKTLFNIIGPMVNPVQPIFRYTGVADLSVARNYHYCYQKKDIKYNLVHSIDGNDEITLTANVKLFSNRGEFMYTPQDFNASFIHADDLLVNHSIEKAAQVFMEVLQNKCAASIRQVVLANSAMAYKLVNENCDYNDAYLICQEVLASGKVFDNFKRLVK